MPLIRKTTKRKQNPFSPANPLADKIGVMRQGVRQLIGAKEGSLEEAKRKTDAYVRMRREKNASYVPQTQSWVHLKDPVYSALVDHIEKLNLIVKDNFFENVKNQARKKNPFRIGAPEVQTIDSAKEVEQIRRAKQAMKAIESKKITKQEYDQWVKMLNIKTTK
jgi:hypothetical protein